jgi:hypothetical protein
MKTRGGDMQGKGRRLAAAVSLLLALAPAALALETDREYGSASFQFLKLPLSPRIVALGGAGAALADGAGDLDLNPAAPVSDSARLVVGKGFPFSEFESGSSHIVWSVKRGGSRILLNARYLGFDRIRGYDDLARPTTPYGAHTLKGQLGYAGRYRRLDYGATLNFAENSIASANYRAAMVNVGARYRVIAGLHAGLSVVNADFWGSGARIEGNEDPFPPTSIQAGLSYARTIGRGFRAAAAVDARTRNDEKLAFPMGLEVSWRDILYARAGFPVAEPEPGLAAGLGLQWNQFRVQYAFQGHEVLAPGHFWSFEIAY